MKEDEARAIFTLAEIPVVRTWELINQYWGNERIPQTGSWWLMRTPKGCIRIGWRKRVIEIDWEDTGVECIVTEDNVTKCKHFVHAWSKEDAIKYLRTLWAQTPKMES